MAGGGLAALTRAVQARWKGEEPTSADLEACLKSTWKHPNFLCWNGKRSDRPECGYVGSQNIPYHAMAGAGEYDKIAECCRVERAEGNFGREIGAPGAFYYGAVVAAKLLAERELRRQGKNDAAKDVRLAIRSNLAWDAIVALPVARTHDEAIYGGLKGPEIVHASLKKRTSRRLAVAVSGMRWSTAGRAALTSEDSHSETLAAELASADDLGLTGGEALVIRSCLAGSQSNASVVASWMFGSIETPNTKWRWRLRRTTLGVESVYLGDHPNPMKPCSVVAQVTHDGLWRSMRPSPRGQVSRWAQGFAVELDDDMIRARCAAGQAEIHELGGDVLWEVLVDGRAVTFTGGKPL